MCAFRLDVEAPHRPHQDRHPAQAQAQPQAKDAIYHAAALGPGEEVPPEAVPQHCGEGRVLCLAEADGDTGEDLVPEPAGQVQAAAGVRAGATPHRFLPAHPTPLRAHSALAAGRAASAARILSSERVLARRVGSGGGGGGRGRRGRAAALLIVATADNHNDHEDFDVAAAVAAADDDDNDDDVINEMNLLFMFRQKSCLRFILRGETSAASRSRRSTFTYYYTIVAISYISLHVLPIHTK